MILSIFEKAGWNTMLTDCTGGYEILDHYKNNFWYPNVNKHAKEFYSEILGYLWKP
jgi:hypothetical protein